MNNNINAVTLFHPEINLGFATLTTVLNLPNIKSTSELSDITIWLVDSLSGKYGQLNYQVDFDPLVLKNYDGGRVIELASSSVSEAVQNMNDVNNINTPDNKTEWGIKESGCGMVYSNINSSLQRVFSSSPRSACITCVDSTEGGDNTYSIEIPLMRGVFIRITPITDPKGPFSQSNGMVNVFGRPHIFYISKNYEVIDNLIGIEDLQTEFDTAVTRAFPFLPKNTFSPLAYNNQTESK